MSRGRFGEQFYIEPYLYCGWVPAVWIEIRDLHSLPAALKHMHQQGYDLSNTCKALQNIQQEQYEPANGFVALVNKFQEDGKEQHYKCVSSIDAIRDMHQQLPDAGI